MTGIAEVQGSHTDTLVVLARLFSNSTPSALQRAIRAYRKRNLTEPSCAPTPRTFHGRSTQLNTVQLDQLARHYLLGATVYQLAADFHIDRKTVSLKLHQLEIEMRRKSPSAKVVEQMADLYKSGLSLATVGKQLTVDGETVRRCLTKAGVPLRPRRGWRY